MFCIRIGFKDMDIYFSLIAKKSSQEVSFSKWFTKSANSPMSNAHTQCAIASRALPESHRSWTVQRVVSLTLTGVLCPVFARTRTQPRSLAGMLQLNFHSESITHGRVIAARAAYFTYFVYAYFSHQAHALACFRAQLRVSSTGAFHRCRKGAVGVGKRTPQPEKRRENPRP